MVVLPSRGMEVINRMLLRGRAKSERRMELRSVRTASSKERDWREPRPAGQGRANVLLT